MENPTIGWCGITDLTWSTVFTRDSVAYDAPQMLCKHISISVELNLELRVYECIHGRLVLSSRAPQAYVSFSKAWDTSIQVCIKKRET